MRHLTTALVLLAGALPLSAASEGGAVAPPATAEKVAPAEKAVAPAATTVIMEQCAHFNGTDSLRKIKEALEKGESPNTVDAKGNTPLLHLCDALEMDYRYRSDPHFANAVDEAFVLLLTHKADALCENADGCNAMFYIQGKPLLLEVLAKRKLLPPELAVRIPHDTVALLRYMRLRVAQAELTNNEESRAYLIRRYCTPAYARAVTLWQKYMRAETRRRIPPYAMDDTLAFMRLADRAEAEKLINDLPLWEHGEHFLEEVPELFLQALARLEWNVAPARLEEALNKLDTMLPRSSNELIDCNAGFPMSLLLEMRALQNDDKLPKLLERFSRSRDARLAYSALCLQLQKQGLPLPEPEAIATAFHAENGMEKLTETQRRLLECAMVDSAIRNGELAQLDADMLRRTRQVLRDMGMPRHAEIVDGMVDGEGLTVGEESLRNITEEYTQLPSPSPQVTLALYILAHPEMFRPANP